MSLDEALRMEKRNPRFHFLIRRQLVLLEQKEEAKEYCLRVQRLGRFDDCGSNTSAAKNPVG